MPLQSSPPGNHEDCPGTSGYPDCIGEGGAGCARAGATGKTDGDKAHEEIDGGRYTEREIDGAGDGLFRVFYFLGHDGDPGKTGIGKKDEGRTAEITIDPYGAKGVKVPGWKNQDRTR